MAVIQVAERPASLDGCFQSLQQTTIENVVRSTMEGVTIKVRRRTTAFIDQADCTVTLTGDKFQDFQDWYKVASQGGVLPTRFKFPPDHAEQVWRFATPPAYEWIAADVFRAAFRIERLPEWVGL